MPDARTLAAAYGVRVEFADLGDWGSATLIAEYDPTGPTIRVNTNVVPSPNVMLSLSKHGPAAIGHDGWHAALRQAQGDNDGRLTNDIEYAIAHELYHHREAIGEIPRLRERAARERAADEFAASLVGAERRA